MFSLFLIVQPFLSMFQYKLLLVRKKVLNHVVKSEFINNNNMLNKNVYFFVKIIFVEYVANISDRKGRKEMIKKFATILICLSGICRTVDSTV